jgi:DNA-damage-inducible protein D
MEIANYENLTERVRQVVRDTETWYSVDDILSLFEDDRVWWKKVLSRWVNGAATAEFEDLVRIFSRDGEELRFVNGVGVFRLIQDIPGKHAERLRRIIAERSFELAQEEADPELAVRRAINSYKRAGRTDDWIKARMRSIVSRHAFTDQMKESGAKEAVDYAILTNIVHEETFAVSIQHHKSVKMLKKENLRDHMTELELTLSVLGEQTSTAVAKKRGAKNITQAKEACTAGGRIAGHARKQIEAEIGEDVVSPANFLLPAAKSIR